MRHPAPHRHNVTTKHHQPRKRTASRREPSFAVIVPCYDDGAVIACAIESCRGQSLAPSEIVVVDDGSKRAPPPAFDGVTLVRTQNRGLAAARNTGVEHSKADWLVFLDADDVLPPTLLETYAHLLHTTDADVVMTSWRRIAIDTGATLDQHEAPRLGSDAFHALLLGNPIACHAFTIHRHAFDAVGGFDRRLRSHEDWWLHLAVAAKGTRYARMDAPTVDYQVRNDSLSTNRPAMLASGLAVLERAQAAHAGCPVCAELIPAARRRLCRHFLQEAAHGRPFDVARIAAIVRIAPREVLSAAVTRLMERALRL